MSEPTITNQLLTINQLSTALGFDARTLRIWCKKGTFPTARRIGTQWRVLSDDIALLSMLDGHSENTAMLADQNRQIAELQTQFTQLQASYDEMYSIYQAALKDADDMEKLLAASHEELNKYRAYYRRQQQERRSGGRRKAA